MANTNFDIHSIFTYDEGRKYIESLTCNTDNECPERSYCIGNKCIVTFYCIKGDKSKCALFKTLCDGKSCYRETELCRQNDSCYIEPDACEKDEDCLNGSCTQKVCEDYSSENGYEYDEYSIGHFTYDNAKSYFEKMDISCNYKNRLVCPKYTTCHSTDDHCTGKFYCKKDKKVCSFHDVLRDGVTSIHEYECNNDDECITDNCSKKHCKKVYISELSKYTNKYGLDNRETCTKDEQCFTNYCIKDKVFFGFCKEPSDSDGLYGLMTLMYIGIALIIIICISCCCCCYFMYKKKRRNNN